MVLVGGLQKNRCVWDIQGPNFNSQSGSGHVIGAIFTWRYESKNRSAPRLHTWDPWLNDYISDDSEVLCLYGAKVQFIYLL